jgi:hypothetical protein
MEHDEKKLSSTLEHLLMFQVSMVSIRRKAIGIACMGHPALPQPQC